MGEVYEIRVFEKYWTKPVQYEISLLKKLSTGKTKKTQFCSTLMLDNGKLQTVEEKRKNCNSENHIWNDSNYVDLTKAIFAWFVDNVKTKRAFSEKDDTVFWHFKRTNKFGNRYTLYDCSLGFIKANLNHFSSMIAKLSSIEV